MRPRGKWQPTTPVVVRRRPCSEVDVEKDRRGAALVAGMRGAGVREHGRSLTTNEILALTRGDA